MTIRIRVNARDGLRRLAVPICIIAVVGAATAGYAWFTVRASRVTVADSTAKSLPATAPIAAIPPRPAAPPPAKGSLLGRFEVPALKMSWPVLEGTDDHTLERSVGHVEGTAVFGEGGNIGLAAHRNTHFRKLEWIRRGDEIVLTSKDGTFRYRVNYIRLHKPTDVEVLDPVHGPAVTLITCFPFEYVGSAPLRFIVRAVAVEESVTRLLPSPRAGNRWAR